MPAGFHRAGCCCPRCIFQGNCAECSADGRDTPVEIVATFSNISLCDGCISGATFSNKWIVKPVSSDINRTFILCQDEANPCLYKADGTTNAEVNFYDDNSCGTSDNKFFYNTVRCLATLQSNGFFIRFVAIDQGDDSTAWFFSHFEPTTDPCLISDLIGPLDDQNVPCTAKPSTTAWTHASEDGVVTLEFDF